MPRIRTNALTGKSSPYRYAAGRYYTAPAASITTGALTDGLLVASPFPVAAPFPANRIACEVTTLAAGATIRLGIFLSAANGTPGELLLDAGTVDAGTTGVKDVTISQAIPAGLIWLAACAQGGAPQVRMGVGSLVPIGDANVANALGQARAGYSVAGVTGALNPAWYSFTGHVSHVPRVAIRAHVS